MATLHELEQALVRAGREGNKEAQTRISDAMLQHPTFQGEAKKKLESGSYKLADDGVTELSKDAQRVNMNKYIARSMGLPDNDVDVNKGMGVIGRLTLSFGATEKDKFKELESRYGRENIKAVEVGGKQKLLYRDPEETQNKFIAVDEEGLSLADFFADPAGAVAPIAGSVAGGIKGAAIGGAIGAGAGGVGAVPGAIIGGVLGAAGGGFAAGAAQDVASRAISGEEIDVGEIAERRGKEALLGAGLDVATLGAGRFVGKPLMKAVGKTSTAQGIMDSMQSLKSKYGLNLEETADITRGLKARETAARRAGETGGALTRAKQSNIDEIGRASRVVDGIEPPTTKGSAIERMQERIRSGHEADIAESARLGNEITEAYKTRATQSQQALQYQLDNEIAGLRIPKEFDPEVSAENFRSAMIKQKSMVSDASRNKFEKGLGDMERFAIPASELQQRLGSTVDSLAGIVSDDALVSGLSAPKVTQLGRSVSKLEEMADTGEMIPFRSLHNLKKSLDDASGYGAVQPSDNQLAARRAATKVRELIDKTLTSAGARGKAYRDANKFFQERITPFRTKAIAPILASDVAPGTFKETGEKLARKVVSDPEYVRQVLKNAGGARSVAKKEMANMYLDTIGTSFDVNPRIASQLFPDDVVKSLQRIRSLKDRLNIPARKISEGDVRAMVDGMSGKARKEAEKVLSDKLKAEARASDRIRSNKLIAKIAQGKHPMPSNPREFADDALRESSGTIRKFTEQMSDDPDALNAFRAGVVENFRDAIKFGGSTAQRTSAKANEVSLWKAGDVEKVLTGKNGEKYRAAMGDDWVKDWIDLDRALKGSEITGVPVTEQVRAVFTTGSGLLLVAAGVPKWAYGRAMNALTGSKVMRPFLRNVQQDPEAMQNLIPYLLSTSEGIQALLEEGKNDPEFAEFIDQQLANQ